GSSSSTPATITSGAISAGTNTVTANPCMPDLWGGPGENLRTSVDASGNLRRNGNLVQVVLDTSGSAAQEVVNVTSITSTGATGINGWATCNVGFTNSF